MSSSTFAQSTSAGSRAGLPVATPATPEAESSAARAGLRSSCSAQGTRVTATSALTATPVTAVFHWNRSRKPFFRIGISSTSYDAAARPVATPTASTATIFGLTTRTSSRTRMTGQCHR